MRKIQSNVILVLPNMTIEPSNVRKKIRELQNVTKKVTCDIETAQYDDVTIKCGKK